MKLDELGEGGLVDLIKEWTGPARGKVRLSVGDDAAIIDPSGTEQIVVSTDAFVEGVHFSRRYLEGNEIGHRIMAGTLSDIAAMAGRGIAAFVNVHAPPDTPVDFLRDVYMGFERVAGPLGVVIAGGDTVRGELAFDVTALGLVPIGKSIGRSGARDGDRIYVSGQLGLAETGRRSLAGELNEELPPALREEAESAHRQPRPRFDVARLVTSLERRTVDLENQREVVEAVRPTSMIDISDGLAIDLSRVCEASNVGCRLEERLIPAGPAARRAARLAGLREMEFALGGGDDYELLFTIRAADEELLLEAARNVDIAVTCVGTITSQRDGRYLVLEQGGMQRLPKTGWDHFAASSARTT